MKSTSQMRLMALLIILVLFTGACQMLPGAVSTPTSLPPATLPAESTQPVEPTQGVPTAAPPSNTPVVSGYVVYDQQAMEFRTYRADGSLNFTSPAPGAKYLSPFTTHAVDAAVYYVPEERKVFRTSPSATELVNVPPTNLFSITVSEDEQLIAWSTMDGQAGESELWMSGPGGSNPRQIARYTAKQSQAFTFEAIEWTADGKLIFNRTPVGFGGYIPFGGHNSLYTFDPTNGEFITIVPAEEMHGLCLDGYRLDLEKVTFSCSKQGANAVIRDLKTQAETTLPKPEGQGFAGSAKFSPSGKWLVYATALGNPDDENGQLLIMSGDLSGDAKLIVSIEHSYPYVQGWLDEDTILFSRSSMQGNSLWTVKRDGSDLKQVATGTFVGLLK